MTDEGRLRQQNNELFKNGKACSLRFTALIATITFVDIFLQK